MALDSALPFPFRTANDCDVLEEVGTDRSIVGTSAALRYVMFRVERVAATNATVLLLGETGTGKELVARAIHQRSSRRHRRFVVVDCGALPGSLIESELFGRERGAFTGAYTSQAGRFETANGGTIFLDEIGELPLELQPKLLRVLQEGEVERLGGGRTARVDVRIIAATNRNLADDVRAGRFRRDLYYRLNVFPITVPPLRERREDLPALVRFLSARFGRLLGRPIDRIAPGTFPALEQHAWPGNIRELENVLQQAIILARNGTLDLTGFTGESIDDAPPVRNPSRSLIAVERDHIQCVLDHAGWRIEGAAGAALILGMPASTLRTRMRKLGIQRPEKEPVPAATNPRE
jgi:transcriptional regulator with GAF, ATPase, and Fis domain